VAGSPPDIQYLHDFHGLGVNRIGSCLFLWNFISQISQSDPGFETAIAITIAIENHSEKNRDPVLIAEPDPISSGKLIFGCFL
jgi:hypothetical protein